MSQRDWLTATTPEPERTPHLRHAAGVFAGGSRAPISGADPPYRQAPSLPTRVPFQMASPGPGRQAPTEQEPLPSCRPRTTRENNTATVTWAYPVMATPLVGFTYRSHCGWWTRHRTQCLRPCGGVRRKRPRSARSTDAVGLSGERQGQAPRGVPPVSLAPVLHPGRDPSTTAARD